MSGKLRNLRFKSTQAKILSIEHIPRVLITWELEPTKQNLNDLKFFVDRGESPEDLEQISTTPIIANTLLEFMDFTTQMKDLNKLYYYRVRAVEFQSGLPVQTIESDIFTWDGDLDFVGLYVLEEHLFALRHVYGLPALIYKLRKDGPTCPDCWDKVLKRVTNSRCTTCYGTGKLDGFYPPIDAWISFDPDPKVVNIADWGERQSRQTDIQFTDHPILNDNDIIFEIKKHNFWKISNVRFPEKNRTTMLQVARLDVINRSDIEYKIDIPRDRCDKLLADLAIRLKEREF